MEYLLWGKIVIKIIRECGAFYNDWISNSLPVILFGMGDEGKRWLNRLKSLNIKVDVICDNYLEGMYDSYEIRKIGSLDKNLSYMILITPNSEMHQYMMIQDLRVNEVRGTVYIASAFKEFNFHLSGIETSELRESIPWFYERAYNVKVEKKDMQNWMPAVPMLMAPKGYHYRADFRSSDFNISDKCRHTVSTPCKYENCIYIYGDSRMYGPCLKDSDTIPSKLQLKTNEGGGKFKVINCSVNPNSINNIDKWLHDTPLKEGDLVLLSCLSLSIKKTDLKTLDIDIMEVSHLCMSYIRKIERYCRQKKVKLHVIELGSCFDVKDKWISEVYLSEAITNRAFWNEGQYGLAINIDWLLEECRLENISVFDYRTLVQRPHKYGEIFIDCEHFSPNGTAMIAEALYKDIIYQRKNEIVCDIQDKYKNILENCNNWLVFPFIDSNEYKKFMEELKLYRRIDYQDIGAIVMNANPFTKGHRYLVECAAEQVEWLYIMVVEEDRSEFAFKDRFEMVRRGVADLNNVCVLRSGKFVISSYTFPDYFSRSRAMGGGEKDINIFANLIAPALGIKYRFVGTEPFSKVTDGYNDFMKNMLPKFGIELIEIARCEDIEGNIISASEVRRRLEDGEITSISNLVPKTTYMYLLELRKTKMGEKEV